MEDKVTEPDAFVAASGNEDTNPSLVELQHSESSVHLAISAVPPPCSLPERGSSGVSKLFPGRQRILASAARQLAASELLVEGLDVCAIDINTHALPPPSTPLIKRQKAQQATQEGPPPQGGPTPQGGPPPRRHALELLRLHALLQAAVGAEQDLVVVGLHQVATQHRLSWAACVESAFAAAEGQAASAIRTHLLGPEASGADAGVAGGGAAADGAAARRGTSATNYEQIVPINSCPHNNQLLLVYVHPSHLHKVTLLSIAKNRLGSYCCRNLQQNYKRHWGLSPSGQERLRLQWEQRRKQQEQQEQQQRMDLFFNFNAFFGLWDGAAAATAAAPFSEDGAAVKKNSGASMIESQAEQGDRFLTRARSPLRPWGLSKRQAKRQQRINQQRLKDHICCNSICTIVQRNSCQGCGAVSAGRETGAGSCSAARGGEDLGTSSRRGSTACGCEVYKEVFAYGGVAARLLIGATPVVVACVDLKLAEENLETCGAGLNCQFCRKPQEVGYTDSEAGIAARAAAAATAGQAGRDVNAMTSAGDAAWDEEAVGAAWRIRVTKALQRQQLLTILADLRFETDSGWASALELKPLLLLGARRQRGLPSGSPSGGGDGFTGAADLATASSGEVCTGVPPSDHQKRLKELYNLGVCTVEDKSFFFCRVPKKAGSITLVENGRAAEWRRPAWDLQGGGPGLGVVARFWVRWMSCRLLVESVDTERVKKQYNELRNALREGRSLSKLLVDPPLLQLPPVRPFEPMQLKICLSNPHESLPTAYTICCLSDSGKSIVPLSDVSYWHGALWRRWESRGSDEECLSVSSRGTALQSGGDSQQQQQKQQQQELMRHEQQRLQQEALRETTANSQEPSQAMPLPGSYITSEADAKQVLRRRIRLERWLLVDSLHGFLKGGETRVVTMTLNIQEGIYSAQDLACGVLVLRLVDSRQDFFCCVAASLMPALLGAELQPLTMLGSRCLLGEGPEGPSNNNQQQPTGDENLQESAQSEPAHAHGEAPEAAAAATAAAAKSSCRPTTQLPLPKELWWLLLHLHAKTAAATAAEARGWSPCPSARSRRRIQKKGEDETPVEESSKGPQTTSENSRMISCSRGSDSSSGDSSCSESDCNSSSCCVHHLHGHPPSGACRNAEPLGLDLTTFLCTTGGETLTWPSFLAGADTYLQPEEGLQQLPAVPVTAGDSMAVCQGCSSSRRNVRRKKAHVKRRSSTSSEDTVSNQSWQSQALKRDVAFLRACLERGVAIPEGVSLCAALRLLEEWGATCCFFPSEFAVQDVQTDSLHLLCRAILLSLPSVHRNVFISLVSAISALLQAATCSMRPWSQPPRSELCRPQHHHYNPTLNHPKSEGTTGCCNYSHTDSANAGDWVGCCSSGVDATHSGCSQICMEVLTSGERGSQAQRGKCLESLRTPQLLRHALMLWTGAWLMKSCRLTLRHAVLDHFIAPA